MTAADAFLRAILAEPGDDALRLIFADFLDDQGQSERAEFIRVQCALAAWPCECDSEERVYYDECRCKEKAELQRRERELFQTYRLVPDIWLAGLPVADFDWGLCSWRRGFLELIRCTCAAWLLHGPAIMRQQPVMNVELSDRKPILSSPSDVRGWAWANEDYWDDFFRGHGNSLPERLYSCLEGGATSTHYRPEAIRYWWPTEAAAIDALSAAALALARKEPAPCR